MAKGVLCVLSGFSGSGKGTIMKEVVNRYDYALSVSATTRKPREGAQEGVSYFFLTTDEFKSMIAENGFIEWAQYVGNYYGTPRAYVEEKLSAGKDVILEIEPQGAMQVKEQYPDAVLIFVLPPSGEELYRRLTGRGTETEEVIRSRMKRASEEAAYIDQYDYVVINDDLGESVEAVHAIIRSARERRSAHAEATERICSEIKIMVP